MKKRPAYFIIEEKDGKIIKKIPMTEADSDWIRAGRLAKRAKEGDQEAEKEIRRMQNTQMYEIVDDDEPEPEGL